MAQLIEDDLSRQLSYAKRRNGLAKKALELFKVCGVDSLFISFSPYGRLSYFCGDKRAEDVLGRFAELPEHTRRQYLTDEEYFELLGIIEELRNSTEKNFMKDSTARALKDEIERAKAELENEKSELISKYHLSAESITTIEEANAAEATLENALAKIRDRLKQLSENPENKDESQMSVDPDGDGNSSDDSWYKEFLTECENISRMHSQADRGLEIHDCLSLETLTSQPSRATVAQTSSPIRENVPQPTSSLPLEQSLLCDNLLNTINNPDKRQTEGVQSSDPTGFQSFDSFVFPTTDLPSPDYQSILSPTQMLFGESSNSADLFGQSPPDCRETFNVDDFLMTPNQETDPLGNTGVMPSTDQNPPPSAARPTQNAVYNNEYETMGLAIDPHFRMLMESINNDGSSKNNPYSGN